MMKIITLFLLTALFINLSVSALAEPKFGKPFEVPLKDQVQPTENTAVRKIGVPPIMPRSAKRSGYCCMLIDVNISGNPENVRTSYCSDSYFKRPSIQATEKWKFYPVLKGGQPVKVYNQKSTNAFILRNSRGRIIQDKEKIFVTRTGFNDNFEDLCASKLIS